jgi:uncharacterized RDD family membrane protein YckC
MTSKLIGLGFDLLGAFLVWLYYRRRTFPSGEKYSTFGPRFWAPFPDAVVLWPISLAASVLLFPGIPKSVAASIFVAENFAWLVHTVIMHARYGQTVGKMVTKVRVVDFRTGGKISWRQACIREGIPTLLSLGLLGYQARLILAGTMLSDGTLSEGATKNGQALPFGTPFWLLSALPLLWFLAEVLTMFTNEKRRALHDFIAGTIVVRTNLEEGSAEPQAEKHPILNDAPSPSAG